MTLTQIRRASDKMNLQRPPSAATSTINTALCFPKDASSLALKLIAIRRTHLPRQPNSHSRVRGAFRAPSPAGSFLGGFRTPATAHVAPSFMAGIRNPCMGHSLSRGDFHSFLVLLQFYCSAPAEPILPSRPLVPSAGARSGRQRMARLRATAKRREASLTAASTTARCVGSGRHTSHGSYFPSRVQLIVSHREMV